MAAVTTTTTTLRAVIVEPRWHLALSLVLCNLFQVINHHHQTPFEVTVFHGIRNRDFVREAIQEARVDANRVTLTEIPGCDNLTVSQYSEMLTRADFWRSFPEEHLLIFQTDSILSTTSPVQLCEFLDFDYVGAPWRHLPQLTCGGNGGLSLRRKSAMVEACTYFAQDPIFRRKRIIIPEDLQFAYYFQPRRKNQYYLPDRHTSARFSVESIYYPNLHPLGIHKAWARLSPRDWQSLKKQDAWFAELECWQKTQ